MDLHKTIRELLDERNRIEAMIVRLERVQETESARGGTGPKRRGRKSMPEDERKIVSERMKQYWERRKGASKQAS